MMLLEELTGIRASIVKICFTGTWSKPSFVLLFCKIACEIEEIDGFAISAMKCLTAFMQNRSKRTIYCFGIGRHRFFLLVATTSFATISWPQHGETLHNRRPQPHFGSGTHELTDAGAERLNNYCSDHRTVLSVEKFRTIRVKDGQYSISLPTKSSWKLPDRASLVSVHQKYVKYWHKFERDTGLMKDNIDEAVAAGAHALFLPHGLGHMMGLDVHDMEDLGQLSSVMTMKYALRLNSDLLLCAWDAACKRFCHYRRTDATLSPTLIDKVEPKRCIRLPEFDELINSKTLAASVWKMISDYPEGSRFTGENASLSPSKR